MTAQSDKYRFGPYELRIRTRELYKYGTRLKLRPQTFLVLQVLVEHAGDVVTREELRELLWPAETFVDFERGLNTLVKELRRILSDSASEPRYVETLPKLGYRIVAPVEAEAACHVAPRSDVRAVGVSTVEETAPVSSRPRRPLSPLWRRVWLSCALATMLIAILAGFIVITRYPGPENSMPVPLTSFPGMEQGAAWSPDGRQVAFAWNGERQDQFDIYVIQPGSSHTLRLTTEASSNVNPAWSPDGRWIAYVHQESPGGRYSLNLVSPLGGPIRALLTTETRMGQISWMPDGSAVVLEIVPEPRQPAALWIVWVETGRHRPLTTPPAGIQGDMGPAVSPDGRTLAFCRATFWRTSELYFLDLKPDLFPAGAPRRVTDLGWVRWPAWTPDSSRVVFQARREGAGMCQLERNSRRLRPIFGVPPTASQPAIARRPGGYTSLIFTNTISEESMLRYSTMAGFGGEPVKLAPSTRTQRYPRYSGDGQRLAFSSDRSGYEEIWVANADGSQPTQLTNLRHRLTEAPDWSPSLEQIAFVSQDRANRQIYVVSASGGPPAAITNEEGITSGDGWSRDGKGYYYTSTRSGRSELWKVPREGGRPQQITGNGGQCGLESTRGIFYYWRLGDSGNRGTLLRRTPDGDQPVSLTPEARPCRTAPSPKGFYFKSAETSDIYLYEEATGRCALVFRHPALPFTQFTVSPDGYWLASDFLVNNNSDLMIMEHFR